MVEELKIEKKDIFKSENKCQKETRNENKDNSKENAN